MDGKITNCISECIANTKYNRIVELAAKVNNSTNNSVYVDYHYCAIEREFVVVIYPPEWVQDESAIKKYTIEEMYGSLIVLNMIHYIEGKLEKILGVKP